MTPDLIVRNLRETDLDRIVRIDRAVVGRSRQQFLERKVARALRDSDLCVSLAVETDSIVVGALLAALQYGEFGVPEPVAVIDTLLVDPRFQRRGIARALLGQLAKNLGALGIERMRTEVDWNDHGMVGFMAASGFRPVPRLVLEVKLSDWRDTAEDEE